MTAQLLSATHQTDALPGADSLLIVSLRAATPIWRSGHASPWLLCLALAFCLIGTFLLAGASAGKPGLADVVPPPEAAFAFDDKDDDEFELLDDESEGLRLLINGLRQRTRNIEDLEEGDIVLAFDERSGRLLPRGVLQVSVVDQPILGAQESALPRELMNQRHPLPLQPESCHVGNHRIGKWRHEPPVGRKPRNRLKRMQYTWQAVAQAYSLLFAAKPFPQPLAAFQRRSRTGLQRRVHCIAPLHTSYSMALRIEAEGLHSHYLPKT